MAKKIEVDEGDLKKIILILKLSKQYLQIPSGNLALFNMWRVSKKLADKLMRKAEFVEVVNKGRLTLKPIEKPLTKTDETPADKPVGKVPRCRKRKK